MKKLILNKSLARAARRCIWYKTPQAAIEDKLDFVAHVLTYGLHEDVKALRRQMSDCDLRYALNNAPPGIFDHRSWNYWHLVFNLDPPKQLPQRKL